jgi:hypothetical protein
MALPIVPARARPSYRQPRLFRSADETAGRLFRWIAPTPSESARLTAKTARTSVGDEGDFGTTLNAFARRLRMVWRVAVLRRSLICGLLIGCVIALPVELAGGTHWLGPIIAVPAALGMAAWAMGAAPTSAGTARFLDHRLNLKEQLATALELSASSSTRARSPLEAAVRREAAKTAHAAANDWSIRHAPAGKEWGLTAALIVAIALIAVAPLSGVGHTGTTPAPLAGGGVTEITPIVPTETAGSKTFAVQVAVVSAPRTNSTSSGKSGAVAVPKAHATVVNPGALGQSPNQSSGQPPAPTQSPSGSAKASSKATPVTGSHSVPLIQGNKGFLPTSPSKGKSNGTFTNAPTKSAQSPGTLGSLAGGSSTKSTKGPSANGKGNASQGKGVGSRGAGTSSSGKQGTGSAQPGTCSLTYACNKLNPKALTAPGLITGKGHFAGQGGKGGQTSGHAAGAPLKPSTAKPATPPAQSKQLTINSRYGSNKTSGARAQQVQGHNGTGTSQQTTVTAGAGSSQSVDYVAPDANIQQPSEDEILSRYFVAPAAS